ncbi:MAG: TylF/MycF/NovP-related O-methyltransferase [Terracidiphilus sp.]
MHTVLKKQLASFLWPRFSSSVEAINRNAQMFTSIREYERGTVERCMTRHEMYAWVSRRLTNLPIDYLEFGVWKGESLRAWSGLNTNSDSRFFGFDSFEGLPETWDHGFGHFTAKTQFDLKGQTPAISDSRVKLVKGWFQHTLRTFLRDTPLRHPIVIHIDCDLHSSALYTLSTLDPFLNAGDIVLFDEYTSPSNEYLAWEEYKRAFLRKAECLASSDRWSQVAFALV